MQHLVTQGEPVKTANSTASSKILLAYYAATALFLLLDVAWGFNVRLAFLETLPVARAAYYGVCFTCLGLILWRPAWTVLIGGAVAVLFGIAVVLGACSGRQAVVQVPVYGPHYCYRTLGTVDCHIAALPDEANRKAGWYEEPSGYVERTDSVW